MVVDLSTQLECLTREEVNSYFQKHGIRHVCAELRFNEIRWAIFHHYSDDCMGVTQLFCSGATVADLVSYLTSFDQAQKDYRKYLRRMPTHAEPSVSIDD